MNKFKVGDKIERTSRPQKWAPLGFITTVGGHGGTYTDDQGRSGIVISEGDWSLVTEGPVRTVTRREIVPGLYGRVKVNDPGEVTPPAGSVQISMYGPMTASDLRSAAMILSQIAEALDDREVTK